MKKLFSILSVSVLLCTTSCKKSFDSLQTDPNRATSVPANLILNGVLSDIYQSPFSPTQRWNQFYACNYAYYGDQAYTWSGVSYGTYNTLKNVIKMEEEAAKSVAVPNPYSALGKFFRAYLFYNLTMQTGDIPVSEALKSLANVSPKYDAQKDVFKQILAWLEESNNDMGTVISKGGYLLSSDFYYNNDLAKWRKAVNAFKLRVLVQLSKQEADADLNIKQKFSETIANPSRYPLFTNMEDNLQYVYNAQYNKYPTNPESFGFDAARYNMTSTFLNTLVSLNDPRTFYVAEPAAALVAGGAAPNSFAAFTGAGSGEDLATMSSNAGLGKYSFINRKRYYSSFTAENTIQIGYPEMCFNIAEAINRGWITGNAEDWYTKGIQAGIGFYGIANGNNTVYFQKPGGTLSDYNTYTINYDWATYYAQPSVKYAGNTATGLNQIITQKYLGFYQNSGWEAYYNWRRTGVPTFHTGPGNGNSNRIALRFQYPTSEKSINSTNVNSAIQNQFAGQDDINARIWVIK
ncbi:RagB/SusD family nutrient uptake outer membrane protein [Ferruginibacter profundus]